MPAYSDRLSHAFAFTAKYYGHRPPPAGVMAYRARPANVAVILVRHGCDEVTVAASLLRHVLEDTPPDERDGMGRRVSERFGPVIRGVALDVVKPQYDERGVERGWHACRTEYLTQLAEAEPRALDACAADELQCAGDLLTALRRLGPEYVRTVGQATPRETIWWYTSLLELLDRRRDWPGGALLKELRTMGRQVIQQLRTGEESL